MRVAVVIQPTKPVAIKAGRSRMRAGKTGRCEGVRGAAALTAGDSALRGVCESTSGRPHRGQNLAVGGSGLGHPPHSMALTPSVGRTGGLYRRFGGANR